MSTLSATGPRFGSAKGSTRCFVPIPWRFVGAERVADDFDARHSATARHYLYRIVNRRAPLTFGRGQAWRVKPRLDADAMHAAALVLLGRHDFSTFRDSQCQANSPIRTLDRVDVRREGDDVLFEASARSFLHRQVRSMVGTLVEVGAGRWSAGDFKAAFEAADRSRCGPVAPPHGLYLVRVDYPALERNKARARAHRCATALRDHRPRPARRRHGWWR